MAALQRLIWKRNKVAKQVEFLQERQLLRTTGHKGPHLGGCHTRHPEPTHPHPEELSVGTAVERTIYSLISPAQMGG